MKKLFILFVLEFISIFASAQKCLVNKHITFNGATPTVCPCVVYKKPDCKCVYDIPTSGESSTFVTKQNYSSFCYNKKYLITSNSVFFNAFWNVDAITNKIIDGDTVETIHAHYVNPVTFKTNISKQAMDSVRIISIVTLNDKRYSDETFRNSVISKYGYYDTVKISWEIHRGKGTTYAYRTVPTGKLSDKIEVKLWDKSHSEFPFALKKELYYFYIKTDSAPYNIWIINNRAVVEPDNFVSDDGFTIFEKKKR